MDHISGSARVEGGASLARNVVPLLNFVWQLQGTARSGREAQQQKTALLIRQTLSLIADSGYPRAARRSIKANSLLLLIHPTSQFTIGSKFFLRQRDTIHFTFYGNRAFERPRLTGHLEEGRAARRRRHSNFDPRVPREGLMFPTPS